MEMKKIACAVIFAAASLSAVMATVPQVPTVPAHGVTAPEAAPAVTVSHGPAAAPGPSSGAADLGPVVGATLLSFVAYYMHF